jgi:Family of unknown function (DUF5906)
MVQFPAIAGQVVIVLQGLEGVGKGTLAKALLHIMGQHGMHLTNASHLVGKFNAHLRDTVFLFADEAFYAGDKAHIGVLNALITESTLILEPKGVDVREVANFLHILMASNHEFVIPASLEARRPFVLKVSDAKRNDTVYFGKLWEQMQNGGYEAMLYDLLEMDLTGFDVRKPPDTEALQEQKKLSLTTIQKWWVDVLQRGYVFRSEKGLSADFQQWFEQISTELLYKSYLDFARQHHDRYPLARGHFGRFMATMGKSARPSGDDIIGEEDRQHETFRRATVIKGKRPWGYKLGTLGAARAKCQETFNLTLDWQDQEEDEGPDDAPPTNGATKNGSGHHDQSPPTNGSQSTMYEQWRRDNMPDDSPI